MHCWDGEAELEEEAMLRLLHEETTVQKNGNSLKSEADFPIREWGWSYFLKIVYEEAWSVGHLCKRAIIYTHQLINWPFGSQLLIVFCFNYFTPFLSYWILDETSVVSSIYGAPKNWQYIWVIEDIWVILLIQCFPSGIHYRRINWNPITW